MLRRELLISASRKRSSIHKSASHREMFVSNDEEPSGGVDHESSFCKSSWRHSCLAESGSCRVFARAALDTGHSRSASNQDHNAASLSVLLIWVTGSVFLAVSGLPAFAPIRFRMSKSEFLSWRAGLSECGNRFGMDGNPCARAGNSAWTNASAHLCCNPSLT